MSCLGQAPDQEEQLWDACASAVGLNTGGYSALERWAGALKTPTLVIFEDYQWVTSVDVDIALARLLSLNENLSFLVLSRRVAALDGAVVTSRVNSRIITEDELQFTEAESLALAATHGIGRAELVADLQEYCGGWPLTIASVLRELRAETTAAEMHEVAARYAHQFYDLLPTADSRSVFLAATAGDHATPKSIAKLSKVGVDRCRDELVLLETLGVVRRAWYADGQRILAHPGVRWPLKDMARDEFGSSRVRKWQVKSAVVFSEIEPTLAFAALLRCEAFEEAQVVLTQHFLRTMISERAVLHQLRGVPEPRLGDLPVMLAARLLLEQVDPLSDSAVVERLTKAMKQLGSEILATESTDSDISRELVALAVLSVAERLSGNSDSLRFARELQRRTESNRGNALLPLSRVTPFLHAIAAFTGFVNGDFALAERGYSAGQQSAKELGTVDEYLRALYGRAATAAWSGKIRDAEHFLDLGHQYESFTGAVSPQLNWMHRDHAALLIALDRLDLDTAAALLETVRPLMHRAEQWPMFAIAETELGRLNAKKPELTVAETSAGRPRQERPLFPGVPYVQHMLAADAAATSLTAGDYQAAERELADLPLRHPRVAVEQARLRLLRGENLRAAKLGMKVANHTELPRFRCEALLIAAVARQKLGDLDLALDAASLAAKEMSVNSLHSPVRRLPFLLLLTLAEALSSDRGEPYLGLILAKIPERIRYEPFDLLTKAEMRTIGALPDYATTNEIAEALFLSANTVKSHLKSIYRKLRVTKRSEAIERAKQLGLL